MILCVKETSLLPQILNPKSKFLNIFCCLFKIYLLFCKKLIELLNRLIKYDH